MHLSCSLAAGEFFFFSLTQRRGALPPFRKQLFVCLHPGCEVSCTDEMLLDQHVKEHFEIPSTAANNLTDFGKHEQALEEAKCRVDEATSPPTELQTLPEGHLCLEPNCNKAFKWVGDLQRHRKTHQIGAKDYDCPATGCARKGLRGFWRSDKLRDHLLAKHGIDEEGKLIAKGVIAFPSIKPYLLGVANRKTPYEEANYRPIKFYLFAIPWQERHQQQVDTMEFRKHILVPKFW